MTSTSEHLRRALPALLLSVIGTAGASSVAGNFDLTSFVPDAGKWLGDTIKLLGQYGIAKGIVRFSLALTFFLVVLHCIKAWVGQAWGQMLRALVLGSVASVLITDIGNGTGFGAFVNRTAMNTWKSAYTAGTSGVAQDLNNGVVTQMKDLSVSLATFVNNAMLASNAMVNFNIDAVVQDPNANTSAMIDAAIAATRGTDAENQKRIEGMTWLFHIGYIIILAFFMSFAAVIYLSGMSIVFGTMLMPVGLAFLPIGNSKIVKGILQSFLVAILAVRVVPIIMLIASNLALGQPTKYLLSQVNSVNTNATSVMQQYVTVVQNCATSYKNTTEFMNIGGTMTKACAGFGSLALEAKTFGTAAFNIMIGVAIALFIMILGLGLGAHLIRSVPGMIGGLLGGFSGSGAPTMGNPIMSALGSAASTMRTAQTLGASKLASGTVRVAGTAANQTARNAGAIGGGTIKGMAWAADVGVAGAQVARHNHNVRQGGMGDASQIDGKMTLSQRMRERAASGEALLSKKGTKAS